MLLTIYVVAMLIWLIFGIGLPAYRSAESGAANICAFIVALCLGLKVFNLL